MNLSCELHSLHLEEKGPLAKTEFRAEKPTETNIVTFSVYYPQPNCV